MLFIIYLSYIFLIWPLLEARAEIQKYFHWFLVQMKSLEFAFEINWPLEQHFLTVGFLILWVRTDFFRTKILITHLWMRKLVAETWFCCSTDSFSSWLRSELARERERRISKGQEISENFFLVFNSSKKTTNFFLNFCPSLLTGVWSKK